MRRTIFRFSWACLLAAGTLLGQGIQPAPAGRQRMSLNAYGRLPLTFEANRGQTDPQVKFLSRGGGRAFFLTSREAVLVLEKRAARPRVGVRGKTAAPETADPAAVVRMRLVGANPAPQVSGADQLPGKSNYFIGNDPKKWRTDVPNYARVRYREVYPGIDLVYYGNQQQLEHDFVVAPGADPARIRLAVRGAQGLRVEENGDLRMRVREGDVRLLKPAIYQEVEGRRQAVEGRYVLKGRQSFGFEMAAYDRRRALVIDPVLSYSTYLGAPTRQINGIAVDLAGNAYVIGATASSDFPTTSGALQRTYGGFFDAFVIKLNTAGSALAYATFLGGSYDEFATSVAVDSSGNAYVTGGTTSADFPTTGGAFQRAYGGGEAQVGWPDGADAFVAKLNPAGSGLVYSTYLGGTVEDYGWGIAVDSSGNAYVTGGTKWVAGFPTTDGAFQSTPSGAGEAFVTKLNAAGSGLVYSTYLGGSDVEYGWAITVDSSGNAYVTGDTSSPDFPATNGAFQTAYSGAGEAFVTKLNATGSGLVYSTFLGGAGLDEGMGIAVDSSGNAYVTGSTRASNFPVTNGAFHAPASGTEEDVFVTKLNANGSALVYSTFFGGRSHDLAVGIAVDSSGSAYITGRASSADFPTTSAALKSLCDSDAFVMKFNAAGSELVDSTCLGGSGEDGAAGIALDSSGNAYITGRTSSADFPTTRDAFRSTPGAASDEVFVTKIRMGVSGPVTTASIAGPAGRNGWYRGPATVTLSATDAVSLVTATNYSLDGGPTLTYVSPFSIPADGVHQLSFSSIDLAGNPERLNVLTIKVDGTSPTSAVLALESSQSAYSFPVRWQGADAGSGMQDFSVYVSDNGGPFVPWLTNTTNTQAVFSGSAGHSHSFFSIARDVAGNVERAKTASDASTTVTPCALDVSSQVSVSRSGFRYENGAKQFVQTVTLRNTGATVLAGPISLVLDSLVSAATLANRSGSTACAAPFGSPFVTASFASLAPGQSGQVTLYFADPTNTGITYTTRVLAGGSTR